MQARHESRPNMGRGASYQQYSPIRQRKKIILCFDGTGNKFSGTDADSNILKIFRMLDRNNGLDKHYYQPGIGTYVNTRSISHISLSSRLNSWYQKAKDSAVGTSFDEHVMGAYKFLMQSYTDDDIFLFGFSRGAYVARFLAEMLDHVGLLSAGNEEMARFAWKAFSQWQQRQDGSEEESEKKKQMFTFLKSFRETFSRPVRRIRFIGLFDTVNSVPRFENAWMQRSKFPYTANSSAKVIRHAVSIDERRAKFRQDLISENKPSKTGHCPRHKRHQVQNPEERDDNARRTSRHESKTDRFRRPSQVRSMQDKTKQFNKRLSTKEEEEEEEGHLMPRQSNADQARMRSLSPAESYAAGPHWDGSSIQSNPSQYSIDPSRPPEEEDELDEVAEQDIEELWFPGCHADLGGGWPLAPGEDSALSHGPLVWMVREAQKAGLDFDRDMTIQLKCHEGDENEPSEPYNSALAGNTNIPKVEITGSPNSDFFGSPKSEKQNIGWAPGLAPGKHNHSEFHQTLLNAFTKGHLHNCLEYNNGLTATSVLSWKLMEYLPFRRMDLRPDGTWKAISFPLPMGEPRDIPLDAKIHHSAIRRMEAVESYRPGNLIIGGGGRGVKVAPKELGIGEWEILKNHGDVVGEVHVRKRTSATNGEKK